MKQTFKIFYSWQSDLPGKDTRNFISSAIDAAAKFLANTVMVIPDRDTKGETGSPNIEQTIFGKIDDCDLFIADLSIVASYTDKDGSTKCTPNPNVLVELGYAVKLLGWENVICFINTDFGKETTLPFDLNHHRVTGYSLEAENRADVKKNLRDIVASTVMTLLENGTRPRLGFASHIVGSYNFETKAVEETLMPFDIQNCDFAMTYKASLLEEAKRNLDAALSIKLPYTIKTASCESQITEGPNGDDKIKEAPTPTLDLSHFQKEKIPDTDQSELQVNVKKFFDIDLDENLFFLGDLEVQTFTLPGMGFQHRGSAEAQEKYNFIQECSYQFSKLQLFESYIKTFGGMLFFPLAIWNKTVTTDSDINISVIVDEETAEVVIPDETLINKDIAEIAGLVCGEQFLGTLLQMPDTSDIVDGSDWEPQISAPQIPLLSPFGVAQEPTYDMDDYVDEIQRYIASPIESSYNEFDFHISKLRPNEKNWVGKGILLKPKTDVIIMTYKITSEHSDGNLEGIMKYEVTK